MDLERAIKRQALAEWRDLQILASASLLNLVAIDALAAFEEQLVDDAVRESLFNPTEWASEHIDVLMQTALTTEIESFLATAASDLLAIDLSLAQISEALRREDAVILPSVNNSPKGELLEPANINNPAVVPGEGEPPIGQSWLTRIGQRVATGATGLATTATAAVNTVSPERLKQRTRLRSAATQRIDQAWVGHAGEPDAVLAQMITLIDHAAYSARTSIS